MKKLLLSALAAGLLFAAPVSSQASQSVDIGSMSCAEFISLDKAQMSSFLMWIDGYLSGKSGDTKMDAEYMQALGAHMGSFCNANKNKTIMDAINAAQ